MVTKRGKSYFLRIRPFGGKEIGVKTPARSKTEARQIEMAVMTACRSGDYRALDPVCREICLRMFGNQGWEIPPDLSMNVPVKDELTLRRAMELFIKYPGINTSLNRERYEQAFVHVVDHWGSERPVKSIWIPEIKEYQIERLNEGSAPSTINKEKSALSKMFQVLVELRHLDVNPARLVKNLSEKSGERQVYLSWTHFEAMVATMPRWLMPIALIGYYAGMRQGEILGLTRKHVNLARRMILLGPEDVKEGHWKRVPIHESLVSILEAAMKVQSISCDRIFVSRNKPQTRHSIRKPWNKAVQKIGLDPAPTFHDLRHTWKTNARRSGMDPEIRESIMGHWYRGKTVTERYGRISDEELIQAVDSMTFDNGVTEILLSDGKKQESDKSSNPSSENLRTPRVQNRLLTKNRRMGDFPTS
jgi:integrase